MSFIVESFELFAFGFLLGSMCFGALLLYAHLAEAREKTQGPLARGGA